MMEYWNDGMMEEQGSRLSDLHFSDGRE